MSIIGDYKKCDACLNGEAINDIYCVDCFLILSETPMAIINQAKKLMPLYGETVWNQINIEANSFFLIPKTPSQVIGTPYSQISKDPFGIDAFGDSTVFMIVLEKVINNFKITGILRDLK